MLIWKKKKKTVIRAQRHHTGNERPFHQRLRSQNESCQNSLIDSSSKASGRRGSSTKGTKKTTAQHKKNVQVIVQVKKKKTKILHMQKRYRTPYFF